MAELQIREPRTYGLDSPWSWFADLAALEGLPGDNQREAANRLARYAAELQHEISQQSREGRYALRVIAGAQRSEDELEQRRRFHEALDRLGRAAEQRSIGTEGGTTLTATLGAAAFVPPYFLLDEWVRFRSQVRAFADQCQLLPLPPYGMRVYIPVVSATTNVAPQVEGEPVAEASPGSYLASAPVQTATGQVVVTVQFRDRGFTGGGSLDTVIFRQLREQLDTAVNVGTLQEAIAGSEHVTSAAASFKIGELYADLAKAREVLTDTPGTRLRPTHIFTTSDFYFHVTSVLDTVERPIVVPQFTPGFPIPNNVDLRNDELELPKWARFTGTVMPGGVLWFTDDAIPPEGEKTRIIVGAPSHAIALLEDEPITSVFVETYANELKVVYNLREYFAAVVRRTSGLAILTGAAYTTALK